MLDVKGESDEKVENSVFSIIAAFTSGLDVFKRLRERRRRKKGRKTKTHAAPAEPSGDELKLSNSLRRAPADIQCRYERHHADAGEKFARGDAIAHASLTEILLKLNSGLVSIISSFLGNGKHDTHLDYKSLTSLSDQSRSEAIDALGQLYQRLSQSRIMLDKMRPKCPCCGSLKHGDCSPSSDARKLQNGDRKGRPKLLDNAPNLARLSKAKGSQTRLVMVRPRNRTATTTSSSSSSSSAVSAKSHSTASTAPTSPATSPLPYPDLDKAALDPRQNAKGPVKRKPVKTAAAGPPLSGILKPPPQRPETWPHPGPRYGPNAGPRQPTCPPIQRQPYQHIQLYPVFQPPGIPPTPPPKIPVNLPQNARLQPPAPPVPRRGNKITPSIYSFASDSTKLGEIPMRKWAMPYDFNAMERLNAEAAARGNLPPPAEREKKKGIFRFLRRGSDDA